MLIVSMFSFFQTGSDPRPISFSTLLLEPFLGSEVCRCPTEDYPGEALTVNYKQNLIEVELISKRLF